jgi:hypothetical protein
MDLYPETQVYNRLWRGRPSCRNAACLRWDAVLGAICAWAELSALVFDLPDEVLATCGEGWTAVHVLLVPRMEVITNGPDDCSPLPDADILREKRGRCPTLGESNSMVTGLSLITWLRAFPNAGTHLGWRCCRIRMNHGTFGHSLRNARARHTTT